MKEDYFTQDFLRSKLLSLQEEGRITEEDKHYIFWRLCVLDVARVLGEVEIKEIKEAIIKILARV